MRLAEEGNVALPWWGWKSLAGGTDSGVDNPADCGEDEEEEEQEKEEAWGGGC